MNRSRKLEHNPRFPGFFKVYSEFMSSKSMQIPTEFVEQLKNVIPKRPILKNSEGRCWEINVERTKENIFFFMNGWPEFVSDISLENGDILVFDYDGKMTFNFMHFGYSTCEQKVHPSLLPQVNAKQSKVNYQDNIIDDEKEDTYEDNDDDNDKEDGDDDEDDLDIGEENESLKEHKTSTWIITHKDKEGSTTLISTLSSREVEEEISELESEDTIFKHGIVKRPKNPYFVTRLRMKRRNQLHIPADVLRDYDIKLPSKVMLLDEEGRKIYVKVVKWKDGRTWLTRGWKSFVKINNLCDEDRCICEFVNINGDQPSNVYINMIVLPAGSWLSK